jgi:spore coat protein A
MLWYHDHVMGVTRFNVYAGLVALIVRDERERELELPGATAVRAATAAERPQLRYRPCRNLTGDSFHKTDPEVMECFSPFTTVNRARSGSYSTSSRRRTGFGS